ncbi:MAG TPA: amidohydrolase [Anaeromyxobacteraceae bacterium]|nr:amidohydrolase [Anaeromyxobacteraceae bacterium]
MIAPRLPAALLAAALSALAAPAGPSAAPAKPSAAPAAKGAPPDVIFTGGRIVTLDPKDRVVQAVAVRDGRFVAVGTDADVRRLAGPSTRIVDLGGRTAVPGLIDAHCHPQVTAFFLQAVDARAPGVPSVAKAMENLAARARTVKPGEWISVIGASASQTKFAERRLPTRAEMDAAAPDNPVWFWNGTHGEVLNSRGLAALGVSKANPRLPRGGQVLLDASGEPTGVLFEAEANVPFNPSTAVREEWFKKDIPALWNARGFTSLNGILAVDEVAALGRVAASGFRPSLRYTAFAFAEPNGVGLPADPTTLAMPPGAPRDLFRLVGLKVWIDGEVDAGSGWCSAPYADPEGVPGGGRGLLVTTQEQATAVATAARRAGLGMAIHASCDASTAIALRAFQDAARAVKGPPTLQRLEHWGQFVGPTPREVAAVKRMGIHLVTQPAWLLFLERSTVHLLGPERAATSFRFGTMVKEGLRPAGSTDTTGVYLDAIDPFVHMKAAVTRVSDAGVVQPGEAVSVKDALRMYTLWAARSVQEERNRGSIEVGKLADMTVLSEDILAIDPMRIDQVKPVSTIVGGEVAWAAP